MNSMKFYEQDKYFMEKMKYLNKGRNKNKNNNFQTCRTVRDSLTVKKRAKIWRADEATVENISEIF